MKVFISWSGEPSRTIASHLSRWLPPIIQQVQPWMSDSQIGSGARWNSMVADALDKTDFGIICVTSSNQHKPWLMFEAGALAKRLDTAYVVPLCIGMKPSALTGPLADFQSRVLDEDGMRALVVDLGKACGSPLDASQIVALFEAFWPDLLDAATQAVQAVQEPVPQRSSEDMLEELIERVRQQDIREVLRASELEYSHPTLGARLISLIDDANRFHPDDRDQFLRDTYARWGLSMRDIVPAVLDELKTRARPAPDDDDESTAPPIRVR